MSYPLPCCGRLGCMMKPCAVVGTDWGYFPVCPLCFAAACATRPFGTHRYDLVNGAAAREILEELAEQFGFAFPPPSQRPN